MWPGSILGVPLSMSWQKHRSCLDAVVGSRSSSRAQKKMTEPFLSLTRPRRAGFTRGHPARYTFSKAGI